MLMNHRLFNMNKLKAILIFLIFLPNTGYSEVIITKDVVKYSISYEILDDETVIFSFKVDKEYVEPKKRDIQLLEFPFELYPDQNLKVLANGERLNYFSSIDNLAGSNGYIIEEIIERISNGTPGLSTGKSRIEVHYNSKEPRKNFGYEVIFRFLGNSKGLKLIKPRGEKQWIFFISLNKNRG